MEKMKINSKIGYRRARVKNGYGPHRMLEMIQQTVLGKIDNEGQEEEEILLSNHKATGVKK